MAELVKTLNQGRELAPAVLCCRGRLTKSGQNGQWLVLGKSPCCWTRRKTDRPPQDPGCRAFNAVGSL